MGWEEHLEGTRCFQELTSGRAHESWASLPPCNLGRSSSRGRRSFTLAAPCPKSARTSCGCPRRSSGGCWSSAFTHSRVLEHGHC